MCSDVEYLHTQNAPIRAREIADGAATQSLSFRFQVLESFWTTFTSLTASSKLAVIEAVSLTYH